MTPKILLADDHSMIRKGLKASFQFELGYNDVAEVASCNQLMQALKIENYTHLVLDINLSDGSSLEILPNIKQMFPDLQIAILSMQPAAIYGNALKQYGALYFIQKTALEEDTTRLFKQFLENQRPARDHSEVDIPNPFSNLTARELELLHYLLQTVPTGEIANILNVKKNTVSTLKFRIFEKTKTRNLRELSDLAVVYNIS